MPNSERWYDDPSNALVVNSERGDLMARAIVLAAKLDDARAEIARLTADRGAVDPGRIAETIEQLYRAADSGVQPEPVNMVELVGHVLREAGIDHRRGAVDGLVAGSEGVHIEGLEAEVARLREGIAQKNELIAAKDRRIYALEHPTLSQPRGAVVTEAMVERAADVIAEHRGHVTGAYDSDREMAREALRAAFDTPRLASEDEL